MNKTALYLSIPATLLAGSYAQAQTFLSEGQALHAVFGDKAEARKETRTLEPDVRQRLEQTSGLRFPEKSFTVFVAEQGGKTAGYAFTMNEIGKSEPITFMVGITPDRKVGEVVMMVFRESRGAEVREPRFMRQFRGKKVNAPLQVNNDIVNYTGATLSSRAIARGVKKALLLLDVLYPAGSLQSSKGDLIGAQPLVALNTAGELGFYRQVRYRMGTECEVRFWSQPSQATAAFTAAFQELERIDRVFSNYRPDSELTAVNSTAALGAQPVSGEFWRMLRFAQRAWRESGQAVDPTVGPLLKAWGFHEKRPTVPTAAEADRARSQVGFGSVWMGPGRNVRFDKRGMELDFGGLAKGYAAQRVGAVLKQQGIGAASINLGESSIHLMGAPPVGVPWILAVRDPEQPETIAGLAELSGPIAVSTSATNENCTAGPCGYSHVFDCRSMQPVRGPGLATVLMQNALEAEVASKALLIGAPSRAQQWFVWKDGVARCHGDLLRNDANFAWDRPAGPATAIKHS